MNRTKKEIVDWLFESCNVTGGVYMLVRNDGKDPAIRLLTEIDKHTKKGVQTIRTYGIPVNDVEDADVLVIQGKHVSSDFEKIKNLLDRVFGSSDSWPDEYCDTLGWRLK